MKTIDARIYIKYYKRLHRELWWSFWVKKRREKLTYCKIKIEEYKYIINKNYWDGVKERCAQIGNLLNNLNNTK